MKQIEEFWLILTIKVHYVLFPYKLYGKRNTHPYLYSVKIIRHASCLKIVLKLPQYISITNVRWPSSPRASFFCVREIAKLSGV